MDADESNEADLVCGDELEEIVVLGVEQESAETKVEWRGCPDRWSTRRIDAQADPEYIKHTF